MNSPGCTAAACFLNTGEMTASNVWQDLQCNGEDFLYSMTEKRHGYGGSVRRRNSAAYSRSDKDTRERMARDTWEEDWELFCVRRCHCRWCRWNCKSRLGKVRRAARAERLRLLKQRRTENNC